MWIVYLFIWWLIGSWACTRWALNVHKMLTLADFGVTLTVGWVSGPLCLLLVILEKADKVVLIKKGK